MRLDVFLKQSRLVKRRTVAKELCDEGAVGLNGHPARAGHDVRAGDRLSLNLRNRALVVTIVEVPERPPSAAAAADLYEVVRDERIRDDED